MRSGCVAVVVVVVLALLGGCLTSAAQPDAAAIDAVAVVDAGADAGGVAGCGDGTRELFADPAGFPAIAGCTGGWSIEGLTAPRVGASCPSSTGVGCAAVDLCAAGWHICVDYVEVAAKAGSSACGGEPPVVSPFFASAQRGSMAGGYQCESSPAGAGAGNDLYGCGDLGDMPNSDCEVAG